MKIKLLLWNTAIWVLLSHSDLSAQTLEELRKHFPGENAVLLNKTLEYNISVKDGKPYVESNELQQIEFLSGTASAFMSQYGFVQSDFQQAVTYEAYTRTANDKKLKVSEFKTATDKESFVFYDDIKETTFNFPAIEPGAVGNLTVSWINKEPHLLSPFYFAGYFANLHSELKIEVSKDVSLKYVLFGLDTSKISVKVEGKHHGTIYTFTYTDCPGERKYEDAPDYAWYSPHVIFYIENYQDGSRKTISYLANTDDLYRLNRSYTDSINRSISQELKHIVDSLTASQTTLEKKARVIYSWVQGQIKYVAFEDGMGGFVPRDANLVCTRRFGDCKDMCSILTMMLNYAGVPAHFTWIGTRAMPYKFTQLPLPLVSNHMICTIKLNDKYIFLDGTDPSCVFGYPSYGIQDKEAMVAIDNKDYKILTVPVIEKSKNVLSDATWIELDGATIKGKIKRDLSGYFAMFQYDQMLYEKVTQSKEDLKDAFQRGSNKFQLDTFFVDKKPTNENLTLRAQFTLPDYAKKIAGEYFLNLNLFKFYEQEEIDYPRRKMPIEYNFLYKRKYITILTIPDGYKVSYLPPAKSFHNDVWGFDLKYEQQGNKVILSQEFDNDNMMITSDKFESWNKVLENLFPLYKESLNLSTN